MNLQEMDAAARKLSAACSPYWLIAVPGLRALLPEVGLSADDTTPVLERSREHANRSQLGRAANWLAAGLLLDQRKALTWLRREGLLRASKYRFDPTIPEYLVKEILGHADDLDLFAEARSRFVALLGLLAFGRGVHQEFTGLMALLRQEPYTLLRSCLITLDLLFLRDAFPQFAFGLSRDLEPFTKEDLAEGFSLLWSLANQELGITRMTAGLWDARGIHAGRYLQVLKRVAALREFSQSEVLIEAFGYDCRVDRAGATLEAPSPDVEKGIRFGYVDGQMQRMRLVAEAHEVGAARLMDLGARLHAAMSEAGLIRLVDEDSPLPRVRFEFPVFPQFTEILRSSQMALEELPAAVEAIQSYGLTPAEARNYRIAGELTLSDVLHVQRLAAVTASCVATELVRRRDEPIVFVNSVSPVYRNDEALEAFLRVVLGQAAARDFRDLFRWPPVSADVPAGFDVQYRPLLEADHEWHVPMFILASSDLVRAAFVLTGQRPGGQGHLVERALVQEFRGAGHLADLGIELRSGGQVLAEIDVAALVDDTLVILECKNSLLPCNVFELRTSRDHCETAARQLDRAVELLKIARHSESLLARLGAQGRPVDHIVTGIVVGNRLFIGSRVGGHLVVSPGHLSNLISRGEIQIAGQSARTRPEGRLRGQMTREFFAGAFYERVFASMVPVTRVIEAAGRHLTYHTYALDMVALGQAFGIDVTPSLLNGAHE